VVSRNVNVCYVARHGTRVTGARRVPGVADGDAVGRAAS
jgi:hypothetical protein